MRDEIRTGLAAPLVSLSTGGAAEAQTATLFGHFSVFNRWAEINSHSEGHFLERVAPGAFARTLANDRAGIRVLFNHGADPQVGNKVLGIPSVLREDERGGFYEVPLLDTSYNADLLPGLRAGAYGASFRFRVTRQNYDTSPARSDYNPRGLAERTIQEAQVVEFGPVTFPAYSDASAGVRSLTDWWRGTRNQKLEAAA